MSNKNGHGGARKGAGRKPDPERQAVIRLKKEISDFISGTDPVKKQKRMLVVTQALYKEASHGNIQAIKEWNDRAIGKAKESVDVTSDGEKLDTYTIKIIPPKEDGN